MRSTLDDANLLIELFKIFSKESFNTVSAEDFWVKFDHEFKKARNLKDKIVGKSDNDLPPQPGFIHLAIVPFFSDFNPPIILRDIEIDEKKTYICGNVYYNPSRSILPDLWRAKSKLASVNASFRKKFLDKARIKGREEIEEELQENFEEMIVRAKMRPVILVEKHGAAWISFPLSTLREEITIDVLASRFPLKFHHKEKIGFSYVILDPIISYPKKRVGWIKRELLEFLRTLSAYRFA